MAQAITNTVQSNGLAGLLGLTPPKTNMQTSTPALIPSQTAAPKSLFSEGTKAPTTAFGTNTQPNFETLSGSNVYVPPVNPATAAGSYTSTGYQPSALTQLGQSAATQPAAKAGTAPTGGLISYSAPAPTNQNPYDAVTSVPSTTPTASPVRGLFPDVLSSLAYGATDKNAALGANSQAIAANAGAEMAKVGGLGANFRAGQLTTGTTPVAEGNAAVTAQTTAAQQAAIAAGANIALQGNAQALTGQNQTQSALATAGNLASPQLATYGQTSFNPADSTFGGANGSATGSLPPDVMQQYAQLASSGQYSAIPSFITSNPVLNAQLNVAAKALNPNYTPVGAQGASGVLQGIPALQSANTAADGIKNTIQSYLQSNPTLNPSNLAAGNQLNQWIQGKQLTDPKYQTLFNYLDEYTNTLAPILGVGGDPTNLKTQIAQGFVNGAASGQSISQVLDAISTLAQHKIVDLQNGATGGSTSVPSTSGGGTGSGGLYDF